MKKTFEIKKDLFKRVESKKKTREFNIAERVPEKKKPREFF